ncbi:hypothetical protein Pflav_011810 [Phytohabitans flavus]|uniref:Uncharacterized protein n=1 Tax=Phytohabitans flavus TaxID=1076124 RepID=A0A6F8XLW2_9ACTN|nr:hypothetical protein Pflav_011810 [Phytohabitans flavus]
MNVAFAAAAGDAVTKLPARMRTAIASILPTMVTTDLTCLELRRYIGSPPLTAGSGALGVFIVSPFLSSPAWLYEVRV